MRQTARMAAAMGLVLSATLAFAACGSAGARITDFGLHRQWRVERDCAHPERPARLVEAPWSEPAKRAAAGKPAVWAGMRVVVRKQGPDSEMELEGRALDAGSIGERIWVQAGLHGAVLRAVVRAPGRVEAVSGVK